MKKQVVLIIEDNPATRKMLRTTLATTKNYTVIEARNGSEGLKMAKTNKPSLIFQGLFLRDMNGFDLNKKLRALPEIQDIPILALTGFLTGLNEQQNQHGFTAFLMKPIEPSLLIETIKVHLPLSVPSTSSIGEGRQILIADDDPIQLKLLGMQLQNAGFQVTTATDGQVALDKAKVTPPDAIVSDILMPTLDGFGLCLAVRQEPKLSNIPVILLTAHYLEDADVDLAHKVGATHYMTRTPDETILINELVKCLKDINSVNPNISIKLESDIKEQHTNRLIRQLEQQTLSSSDLLQQSAIKTAQLYLLTGVAETLTKSNKKIDETLADVLYYFLDAAGISKGALYIKEGDDDIKLQQIIGYKKNQRQKLETFFGKIQLLNKVLKNQEPFAIPSKELPIQETKGLLKEADVQSALIVPLTSGSINPGILFLGSDSTNLIGENPLSFARTLGMQLGQSMALAQAFENLAISEEQHRQLVEISPDAIFILQEDKFSFANAAGLKLLGAHKPEQLLNQSVFDYFKPESRLALKEYMTERNKGKQTPLIEGKIETIDKSVLDVEVVASPFTYQNKPAVYLIIRDITERKRSRLYFEVQYAISLILAESTSLQEATTQILKVICERLNWDIGAIWAVDAKANVLRCITVWQAPTTQIDEFKKKSLSITFERGMGFPGKVWKNRKAVWHTDLNDLILREQEAASAGLKMGTCFPIIYENEVLGIIEFFSKNIFQEPEGLLSWFESIGNQFGLFLKRKHMEGQMLYLAEHDALTGLINRKLVQESLHNELIKVKKTHKKVGVLFLDLDQFKMINDSVGHQVGDILLVEISKILQSCVRPQDLIGRVGGDEFIIVLPDIDSDNDVIQIAEKIQKKLENKISVEGKEFFITSSMGISFYPKDGNKVESLIKGAEIAMYRAKEKGRNNFQFCTPEMTTKAENRIILQNDLRQALKNG
ncbi:MAG TPA: diguanylate cyclase [Alphaproteobacteria bacterium]|nr:diguanylate cyclase [Alphaproteobacteria bacterium]